MSEHDDGVFSYHLVHLPVRTAVAALVRPPGPSTVPGLRHLEVLAGMELGSPVFSRRRMQLPERVHFVRWGRPVERLVREDPGTTLFGRSAVPGRERHTCAMAERERRDVRPEFTALRFRALSERGSWDGATGYVPT